MSTFMKYNPAKHHRQSIRLKGYDYSTPGYYFITVCTQDRVCRFGEIIDGKTVLNAAGKMIEKWYFEIPNKFPKIKCDEYTIMPNHFHCIIEIPAPALAPTPVRMALCGHPESEIPPCHSESVPANLDTHVGVSLRESAHPESDSGDKRISIFEIMDWFKTMSTNEYIRGVKTGIWQRFEKRVWQLRYWDHIIRDNNELFRIRQYIKNNPSNWQRDKLHGGTGNCVLEEATPYGEESWMI